MNDTATCRKCGHWEKCSKADGTTKYYGKEIACNDAEILCEWFINAAEAAPKSEVEGKMTDKRKSKMIEMANNGISYAKIGIAFNVSRQRVFQILNSKVEVVPKIDVEVLEAELSRYAENCKRMVQQAKQEVALKIFDDIHREIEVALKSNYDARKKRNENRQWRRINDDFINTVNGKIAALRGMDDFITELEKNYTEGKNDQKED